jgi:hypothetical protein
MNTKALLIAVLGLGAAALPAVASAQPYGGYWGGGYGDYARRNWYESRQSFPGYPEFRGEEMHIRREIQEAVRDDMIDPDDAADLFAQLRRIQAREAREFSFHGWYLPDDDRRSIRAELDQLDHTVDQVREEP